ncbi:MAG: protease-like activity factor CPAF [Elusimicrobiota bacterium]|nr:protease-like activity factor CPAF [Elusimicrobiota bacterium]
MIVERAAVKKSIAVSLILALGLSLPGTSAWAQTYNARVTPGVSAAGASAAASVTGALSGSFAVPSLSAGSLNVLTAPVLSAPALAPSALAFVPSALAAVPVAPAAAKPVAVAAARAAVSPAKAAVKAAQAAPAPLAALAGIAGESASAITAVEVVSVGRMFDGSAAEARAPALDLRGRGPLVFSSNRLRAAAAPSFTPASPSASPTQQRMVRTLHQVASIFAEQYAPLDMKKDRFQLDLKREYDKAKAAILADPEITTRKFQDLLASLVASMRDYHVSISFHSTESSKLPFSVAGAEGRYYLTFIDREKLPKEVFPFEMGDELVSFAGKPTAEAVKAIAARMTANVAQTDMRMAELFLTNRRRARGDNDIPNGAAHLVIRRKGEFYKVTMPWDYTPELIAQDVPARNAGMLEPEGFDGGAPAGPVSAGFFSSAGKAIVAAVHPLIELFANMRADAADNPFMIGARKSFVPRLGKVLWRSDEDSHFDAYIFETKDGKKKGYIRIAAYDGDYAEVREFAKIMAKFQVETDALVIDQVSNPGGSVFYLYALASHLTDKVLVAPRHRMIIGEAEAHQSAEFLLQLMRSQKNPPKEKKKKVKEGTEEEPPNAGGYPITAKFMQLMVRSAQYILEQFTDGKRYTGLIHVSGVDDIDPAPKAAERYTKPILLLTNALDFSGGDFFPAILQDNKRATVMGVRTAGAGGIVKSFSVNQFGIDRLSATTSLAQRPNGQPIENLGVTPDLPYEITARDLRTGFAEYRWKILKALEGLLDPGPAPPAAPAAPQGEK